MTVAEVIAALQKCPQHLPVALIAHGGGPSSEYWEQHDGVAVAGHFAGSVEVVTLHGIPRSVQIRDRWSR